MVEKKYKTKWRAFERIQYELAFGRLIAWWRTNDGFTVVYQGRPR